MMAMMDEVLTDLESDVSVWGLRTRVDLVACGDEDGTSPCGWPPGFFLLFNFEINRIMFASSVLMAVWAGSGDLSRNRAAERAVVVRFTRPTNGHHSRHSGRVTGRVPTRSGQAVETSRYLAFRPLYTLTQYGGGGHLYFHGPWRCPCQLPRLPSPNCHTHQG
jgi:hypothetical protein